MDDCDVFECDIEEIDGSPEEELMRAMARQKRKNRAVVKDFIGGRKRYKKPVILPSFFSSLLTWALYQQIERGGWKLHSVLGYYKPEPKYQDIYYSLTDKLNLVVNGQLLLEKGTTRIVVTVDMNPMWRALFQLEGRQTKQKVVDEFADAVEKIAEDENFYRGQKLEFSAELRFMEINGRTWDSIILPEAIKSEIRINTVEFLEKRECWSEFGIPLKRGVLISGLPGTGKTAICKALFASAKDITCIAAMADLLDRPGYIEELYFAAQKLKPCIVFMEDIDMIAQSRAEYGYSRSPALFTLLNVLDGVEEQYEIVTVATTNHVETLDNAIRNRPSRFDRTIALPLPDLEQRRELVARLCQKIPLSAGCREAVAVKTDGCTPAVVEGVVRNLFLENYSRLMAFNETEIDIDAREVSAVVYKTLGTLKRGIGYALGTRTAQESLALRNWNRSDD